MRYCVFCMIFISVRHKQMAAFCNHMLMYLTKMGHVHRRNINISNGNTKVSTSVEYWDGFASVYSPKKVKYHEKFS